MAVFLRSASPLTISESAGTIEVVSKPPGFRPPVLGLLLLVACFALVPWLAGFPKPEQGLFGEVWTWLWLLGCAGGAMQAVRIARASGRVRLGEGVALLLENELFGNQKLECPLSELEVLGVRRAGGDDEQSNLFPTYCLALRFGYEGKPSECFEGHAEAALEDVAQRLRRFLKENERSGHAAIRQPDAARSP